jgi:hypothetical protein
MKTLLALLVAATSVLVCTQTADAQYVCETTVSYAPVATTSYYAPAVTAYVAPTTAYYAPTTAYVAPTTAYYGGSGYYGGYGGYYGPGYRGGLFGTGLFGWAGLRGIDRRWDRRSAMVTPY